MKKKGDFNQNNSKQLYMSAIKYVTLADSLSFVISMRRESMQNNSSDKLSMTTVQVNLNEIACLDSIVCKFNRL